MLFPDGKKGGGFPASGGAVEISKRVLIQDHASNLAHDKTVSRRKKIFTVFDPEKNDGATDGKPTNANGKQTKKSASAI